MIGEDQKGSELFDSHMFQQAYEHQSHNLAILIRMSLISPILRALTRAHFTAS